MSDILTFKVDTTINNEITHKIGIKYILTLNEQYNSNGIVEILGTMENPMNCFIKNNISIKEALYLFGRLNYDICSFEYDDFFCGYYALDNKIIIEGDESFYKECMEIFNKIELDEEIKEQRIPYLRRSNSKHTTDYVLEVYSIISDVCNKYNISKNIKAATTGRGEFDYIECKDKLANKLKIKRARHMFNYDEEKNIFIGFDFDIYDTIIAGADEEMFNFIENRIKKLDFFCE